uniref:Uncharacterized protein n=1 Tax=Oryza rufipogon TaxID=4529 RepID=A0A0E0PLG5_ORYRU
MGGAHLTRRGWGSGGGWRQWRGNQGAARCGEPEGGHGWVEGGEEVAGARRERRAASHWWPQPSAEATGAATEEKGGCRCRCFDTRWLFPGYN